MTCATGGGVIAGISDIAGAGALIWAAAGAGGVAGIPGVIEAEAAGGA